MLLRYFITEPGSYFYIRHNLIVVAKHAIGNPPVIICICILRVDLNGLVVILYRLIVVAKLGIGEPPRLLYAIAYCGLIFIVLL